MISQTEERIATLPGGTSSRTCLVADVYRPYTRIRERLSQSHTRQCTTAIGELNPRPVLRSHFSPWASIRGWTGDMPPTFCSRGNATPPLNFTVCIVVLSDITCCVAILTAGERACRIVKICFTQIKQCHTPHAHTSIGVHCINFHEL